MGSRKRRSHIADTDQPRSRRRARRDFQVETDDDWIDGALEVFRKLTKMKETKILAANDTADANLLSLAERLEDGDFSSAADFANEVRQVLTQDVEVSDDEEREKIRTASEKLLTSFERMCNDLMTDDIQRQSSDYDSGSSDDQRQKETEERPRRASVKSQRRRSDKVKASSRDSPALDTDEWDLAFADKILNRLIKNRNSWPFLEPVDPVSLELDDYSEIVKEPMDLGTVKQKLKSSAYASSSDFEKDVRLVFHNAMLYNHEGDEIWAAAKALLDVFESCWSGASAEGNLEAGARPNRAASERKGSKKRTSQISERLSTATADEDESSTRTSSVGKSKKEREDASGEDSVLMKKYLKAVTEGGWKGGALEVVSDLMEHENAWPFINAANQDGSRKQIDLSSIKEKLLDGTYIRGGRKEFVKHIRSVLGRYQDEGDERCKIARELLEYFEKEFAMVCQLVDSETRKPGSSSASVPLAEEVETDSARPEEWSEAAVELKELLESAVKLAVDVGEGLEELQAISDRLGKGGYGTPAEFAADVRQQLTLATGRLELRIKEKTSSEGASGLSESSQQLTAVEEKLKGFILTWSNLQASKSYSAPYRPLDVPVTKRELPWRSGAEKVLAKIMHLKDAWPFVSPVDPSIAPDYFDVIANPMDLGTVHENLIKDRYRTIHEWVKDVHLVFDNAEDYNGEGDHIFKLSLRIRAAFDSALEKFLSTVYPSIPQLLADFGLQMKSEEREGFPAWLLECRFVLRQLLFHPCAWPFLSCTGSSRGRLRLSNHLELTSIKWLLECGYYGSAAEFVHEVRSLLSAASGELRPLAKELLAAAEQTCIFQEASGSVGPKDLKREKKRTAIEVFSDLQIAEANWEADCLVLMDRILAAPNAWPFRQAAVEKRGTSNIDGSMSATSLDGIRLRLQEHRYLNALEWATDVRKLLSSFIAESSCRDDRPDASIPSASKNGDMMDIDDSRGNDESFTDSGEYIALDDETPRSIAQKLGVSPDLLVSLNKSTYSGLHLNAKLHKGTILQVPPRNLQEASQTDTAGPVENKNIQLDVDALISTAATAVLASFDAQLRRQIASGSKMSRETDGSPTFQAEPGETVVRLRKAQRFFHSKQDRRMNSICKILEEMIKDPDAWPFVDGVDPNEHPAIRNCRHTMNLSIIKAGMELGVYAAPQDCAADIRLVLELAVRYCNPGSALQQIARKLMAKLEESLIKANSTQKSSGAPGDDLSLKSIAVLKSVKALLDKMMKRPQNSLFLEPVDPEEDGCEDYLEIIQEPMDLGTIKDYLESGAFETVSDFADNVRLMYKNALTYNPDGSSVHKIANECLQAFEADLGALVATASSAVKATASDDSQKAPEGLAEEDSEQSKAEIEETVIVPECLFRELERSCRVPSKWWFGYDEHTPLPYEWEAVLDIGTQKTYYWNRVTKAVSWEQPSPPQIIAARKGLGSASGQKSTEPVKVSSSSDPDRAPRIKRGGEYFCPIMCCWRPIESSSTQPPVQRLNDPASVVLAQRRRTLLGQPGVQQQMFSANGIRGQPQHRPAAANNAVQGLQHGASNMQYTIFPPGYGQWKPAGTTGPQPAGAALATAQAQQMLLQQYQAQYPISLAQLQQFAQFQAQTQLFQAQAQGMQGQRFQMMPSGSMQAVAGVSGPNFPSMVTFQQMPSNTLAQQMVTVPMQPAQPGADAASAPLRRIGPSGTLNGQGLQPALATTGMFPTGSVTVAAATNASAGPGITEGGFSGGAWS